MEFTRENVKDLRVRLNKALEAEFDGEMEFKIGGLRYSETECDAKITVYSGCGEEGGKEASEKSNWDRCCHLYGCDPEDFGAIIKVHGKRFELIGLNTRAPKYPFKAKECSSGSPFKLPKSMVQKGLTEAKTAPFTTTAVAPPDSAEGVVLPKESKGPAITVGPGDF